MTDFIILFEQNKFTQFNDYSIKTSLVPISLKLRDHNKSDFRNYVWKNKKSFFDPYKLHSILKHSRISPVGAKSVSS